MPARKPFLKSSKVDEELLELLKKSKDHVLTEDELSEQRVSFAFGNAMANEKITKESVRRASTSIRLQKVIG